MTALNDERVRLLADITAIKSQVDDEIKGIEQRMADLKWEAEAPLRQAVRDCVAGGVPYRQIGFAINTSDHKTVKNLENDIKPTKAKAKK